MILSPVKLASKSTVNCFRPRASLRLEAGGASVNGMHPSLTHFASTAPEAMPISNSWFYMRLLRMIKFKIAGTILVIVNIKVKKAKFY